MENIIDIINETWENRSLLSTKESQKAILESIELLDKGKIRVAEPHGDEWKVNEWVKKAVVMYFYPMEMSGKSMNG